MRKSTKKIVLYFGKKRKSLDPFKDFGLKRQVYYELFKIGIEQDFEMYVSSGRKFYFGGLKFGNLLKYENGKFKRVKGIVKADAVYDRSGGLKFPDVEISSKTLNSLEFKTLCADKMLTYQIIGEFMPESFPVSNRKDFKKALSNFVEDEIVVLKPLSDFGGKGIVIACAKEIAECKLSRNVRYKLQRFVETADGIPGIVEGRHDLRIVVVNGKVVLAHVRTPVKGGYLANVAQGGEIKEVELTKIPESIMRIVSEVQKKIDVKFDKPLYSIDFGVDHGRLYVFELNDRIGFPREDMWNAKMFVEGIIDSLQKLVEK